MSFLPSLSPLTSRQRPASPSPARYPPQWRCLPPVFATTIQHYPVRGTSEGQGKGMAPHAIRKARATGSAKDTQGKGPPWSAKRGTQDASLTMRPQARLDLRVTYTPPITGAEWMPVLLLILFARVCFDGGGEVVGPSAGSWGVGGVPVRACLAVLVCCLSGRTRG